MAFSIHNRREKVNDITMSFHVMTKIVRRYIRSTLQRQGAHDNNCLEGHHFDHHINQRSKNDIKEFKSIACKEGKGYE